jgi:CubicO group peptidase (beta-lactamase class C family)
MRAVDTLMRDALAEGVFPGAVIWIQTDRRVVFRRSYGVANQATGEPVCLQTVFDLASLTKPLATTLAVMHLIGEGRLSMDQTLGDWIVPAAADKGAVRLDQLLNHTSGMADYRPYYETLRKLPLKDRRPELRHKLMAEALVHAPGEKCLYSDLGFMALAWVVETAAQYRLDQFVTRKIYHKLGLKDLFFSHTAEPLPQRAFAATEKCPWRQELMYGRVHDDNAYVVGGVEGHAGLFGSAGDVAALLEVLLADYRGGRHQQLFPENLVRRFWQRQLIGGRALGFDMPSEKDSSAGRYFSANSVGHLGYTGTSFWIDLDRGVTVLLLTNRVHPSRSNEGIRDFRPLLHDTVMAHL